MLISVLVAPAAANLLVSYSPKGEKAIQASVLVVGVLRGETYS